MGKKYFVLGTIENSGLVKIIRIVFGVVCIAVAVFWLIFNIRSLKADGTLWITIIFLSGFGFYQIWSGLGMATRFIEISHETIRLKNNAILPPVIMRTDEIESIELLPLQIIFHLILKKKLILRFGTTYYETNQTISDEIIGFAESKNIPFWITEEEM
jgi:Zn-dependent protease with chaperone function